MKIKSIIILLILLMTLPLAALERAGIEMTGMPMINVNISGFVRNPGSYRMMMGDNLITALERADLDELILLEKPIPLPVTDKAIPLLRPVDITKDKYKDYQSLRMVRITRDGAEEYYDLLKYLRLGDASQNPVLRDGDNIFVDVCKDFVSVWGSVGHPGYIEYQEGDSIADLIALAGGSLPGAELNAIQHSIYQADTKRYEFQSIDLTGNGSNIISAGDRIMVPYDTAYQSRKGVTLSGRFVHQGEYLFSDGDTIWDVIQKSGGVLDDADLHNAVVMNKHFFSEPDYEFERIIQLNPIHLTPLEYSYLRVKLRQIRGRYSIDFAKIIETEGEEGDMTLSDGDHIYLPLKTDKVYVSGQVNKPGFVDYKEGEDWKYYIAAAGGFAKNRKVIGGNLIQASTGNWVKLNKKTEIQAGDSIFIPEKTGYSFWPEVRDTIAVMASAVSIVLGIHNLTK
ncbi:MAG TPA: hypothetical protein GXX77_01040 [Candidatus Cloacimonetes bacterium]|nr:hypothetical protein [Candidatus Cloacimonadota bacterium]